MGHRIEYIPVRAVRLDRTPLDAKTFYFALSMKLGELSWPPIKVARLKQGGYVIRDGRHRVTAAKLAGLSHLKARCSARPLLFDAGTFCARQAAMFSSSMLSMITGKDFLLKARPIALFSDAVTHKGTSNGVRLTLRARPTSKS